MTNRVRKSCWLSDKCSLNLVDEGESHVRDAMSEGAYAFSSPRPAKYILLRVAYSRHQQAAVRIRCDPQNHSVKNIYLPSCLRKLQGSLPGPMFC